MKGNNKHTDSLFEKGFTENSFNSEKIHSPHFEETFEVLAFRISTHSSPI